LPESISLDCNTRPLLWLCWKLSWAVLPSPPISYLYTRPCVDDGGNDGWASQPAGWVTAGR